MSTAAFNITDFAIRTPEEVREILEALGRPVSRSRLYAIEQNAFAKLRKHPEIQAAFRDLCEEER